jgi:chaperone required for assembly of F1-ATPase
MRDFLNDVAFYSDPDPVKRAQKNMAKPLVKRFYKSVSVAAHEDKFCILLDGKMLKTPNHTQILLPNQDVAQKVADEFERQEKEINPAHMPKTRLVNTALDGVAHEMDAVRAEIVRFFSTDLICYRADFPQALAHKQNEHWDKYILWLKNEHHITLHTTVGIMHIAQDQTARDAFNALLSPFHECISLSCLHTLTSLLGSAVLALAVATGFVSHREAWCDANIDEDWTVEQWGSDAEAQKRRATQWAEFDAAYQLLRALKA